MAAPTKIYLKAPDGAIVAIPAEQQQDAFDQGYTATTPDAVTAARQRTIDQAGPAASVQSGLLQAPAGQEGDARADTLLSGLTFGQFPGLDTPEAVARDKRYEAEHPYERFGVQLLSQLPAMTAVGAGGAALRAGAAGLGLAARAGAAAADYGLGAAVGGAQTEGEEARLAQRDFSVTDLAITGGVGEVLGRSGAWALSKAIGGARNLLARGEREIIADNTEKSLASGGMIKDYQNAAHADAYHGQLADLASKDLDRLEENFAVVSDQARKRARITRLVTDNPEAQEPIAVGAADGLRKLRASVRGELESAQGPGKHLLKQLDDRITALDQNPTGKRLWRTLDENRQALQQYAQDLHQSYANNPGSAWLSRDGLAAVDEAEKFTREALLRDDAWGEAATAAQRAYNDPFHTKYFPARQVVLDGLHFSPQTDAQGFRVFRGEPSKVQRFLTREPGDLDAKRLGDYFAQYLDGAEAVARAGAGDSPAAAREVLEATRRLRRAQAAAAMVSASVERTGGRAALINHVGTAAGGVVGAATGGPFGAAGGIAAVRGARLGDWLARTGRKFGWFSGEAVDMAKLLEKGALPQAAERKPTQSLLDDLLDASPDRGPSEPPPSGGPGGAPPPVSGVAPTELPSPDGGGYEPAARRGYQGPEVTPSVRAELEGGARPTAGDAGSLPPEARVDGVAEARSTRRASRGLAGGHGAEGPGTSENGLQWYERLTSPGDAARQADAARARALTEGEFAEFVNHLKSVDAKTPSGERVADLLESHAEDLRESELIVSDSEPPARGHATAPATETPEGAGWTPAPEAEAAPAPAAERGILDAMRGLGDFRPEEGRGLTPNPGNEATEAMRGLGLNIPRPGPVARSMEGAFNGRLPSKSELRDAIPMDLLQQLGGGAPTHTAVRAMGSDGFSWEATGPMHVGPDGYEKEAYTISRTFSRDRETGKLEVHHDHFFVHDDLQGTGLGAKVIARQMRAYSRMGVDVVSVDAIQVGKYFWPSIGFNCDADGVSAAKQAYGLWLRSEKGVAREEAEKAIASIKSLPSLAQAEFGKEFLLEKSGRWNSGLRIDLSDTNPLYHLMRGRLDVAAAGALALGGALEGAREARDAPEGETGAGGFSAAMAPMALFGGRVGLFKSARTALVSAVAKRLFTAVVERAVPRTVARLAYSRAQLAARQQEFQSWAENPQQLVNRVAEGFRDVPPGEPSSVTNQGVFAAAAFLKQKLPAVTQANTVSLRQIPVSTDAMAKYARYEQAALHPRDAVKEAGESGHISTELLETLKALYPDLLAEWRVHAYLQIRESGPPPTIQSRAAYAALFDGDGSMADAAFSIQTAQQVSSAYDQVAAVKPAAPGASPTPGVSRLAVSSGFPGALGRAG